jgi:hypothetical protein
MNKGGRLKGVALHFMAHSACGQAPKFLIDQWQQFLTGSAVALLNPTQNVRDFGHSLNVRRKSSKSKRRESVKSFV